VIAEEYLGMESEFLVKSVKNFDNRVVWAGVDDDSLTSKQTLGNLTQFEGNLLRCGDVIT
jgi:hypothetical protein